MGTRRVEPRSIVRMLVIYGAVSLVPVLLLGLALALSYKHEAQRRGIAEGRSEAVLVAQTGVEPLLDGRPLGAGLSPVELDGMKRLIRRAVWDRDVLRLRMRDLSGHVVFSDDGSGFNDRPESEAMDAAGGKTVALLTRMNSDRNDSGPVGASAVEVYLPLLAGIPAQRVGVLEMYLPYTPISHDVAAGVSMLYRNLSLGLGLLWLALLGISWSVSKGLRSQVAVNAYQAEHDDLTGLPNRLLFHRLAAAALLDATAKSPVAIAIVDLDRFKEVNDTLGHHNGDQLLTELARRLRGAMRSADTVARLGGDEFGLILRNAVDGSFVLAELRHLIEDELEINGLPLAVEASIGFVLAPDDGAGVDTLLQRADVAMYVAKAQHAGVVRYDADQDHYDATNLTLIAEMRHAIDDDQLVLHYQPKVTLDAGEVEAVEALVRWQHPVLGLLAPDRFLPLAEQTELIDKLTEWVLDRAVRDLLAAGPAAAALSVAVNVSARNLARVDFPSRVAGILARQGFPTTRLIIEITETALLVDPVRAASVLAEVAASGVRVSIDDFGCGQTSLGYLSVLTIHELKIDRSFVAEILTDGATAAIVRSIVDLGHNLGLRVVGEGVENADVLARLRSTGCDVAQGFLLARPMPAGRLGQWLRENPAMDMGRRPDAAVPSLRPA